jgi:hypothetical protein
MNITGSTQTQAAPVDSSKRADLQMLLLKKALQSQKDQAAEILKEIEGKGQTIDFRA